MRIKKEETAALFVDLQERLIPAMDGGAEVVARNVMLLEGLKVLGIPAVFLRQYPKGLGDIVPEVREAAGDYAPFDKLAYSAMKDETIAAEFARLRAQGIQNILVTGVESHVCVLQSCIDLAEAGFTPVLVADCVASRNVFDKKIGLKRAVQEHVLLTTAEAILFELCVVAGTPEFKAISKLVR
ncbi:MAG: isochorismatase family protein [Oscillospiraceae bacterium]|nr:isochorismatase family protein [Oscillospiraceae bacterium]